MQRLSKDEKVPTSGNTNLPLCQLHLHHCYMQIAWVNTATLSYGRRLNDKTSDHFAFHRIDNILSIMKSPTEIHSDSAIKLLITSSRSSCRRFPRNKAFLFRQNAFVGILASLQLCLLVNKLSLPASVSLAVSDPTAELSPAVIFATVYILRSHT